MVYAIRWNTQPAKKVLGHTFDVEVWSEISFASVQRNDHLKNCFIAYRAHQKVDIHKLQETDVQEQSGMFA